MTEYDRRARVLATALAALAGYVDAIGFLSLDGFFVSFMSGNTTRLGVGIALDLKSAMIAGLLVATFVGGVILGTLLRHLAGGRPREAALLLITLLLAAGAGLGTLGHQRAAIGAMALAMGAANTVLVRDGSVPVGLTYMTGTLVKLGQRSAAALLGEARWSWVPYLIHWLSLGLGSVLGALVEGRLGLQGLWLAAFAAACLLPLAAWPPRHSADGGVPAEDKD